MKGLLDRHASDGSYPKALLPSDLIEEFRLASPIALPVLAGRDNLDRSIGWGEVKADGHP